MDSYSIQLFKKALRAGVEKVYNIRVMVVGQSGVGKTTLIKRLLGQPVDINEKKSTEGIDVHKHCCKLPLDTGEWIQQHEDSDQLHTLNRLIKLLPVLDQKPDISQEQEGIREVNYQREITSEIDATNSNVPSTTSVSDQEVQSTTQVSITRGYEIHHVEHLDKETDILTVPLSDAKSSESEKKTKDAMMEILRLVNEKADKLVKDVEKYAALSIWDFAGHYAFFTTNQMFLTSRAIYLLVIDLSQQITNVTDQIQIWTNSIHSSVKSPGGIIPVILVGTHVDKIPEKSRKEVIDKYFKELRYMLKEKPTIRHLMDDIAIDNTQPDPMLEKLRKRIFELSKRHAHWGEKKPARWLPLEQAIMTLKASGTKVVPLSLIEEINMSGSVKIEDRNELELFLKFHHDIGTVLYFSVEELRKKIVLDPQWMIDAFKSLITAETFISKNPAITSKFHEFIKTGKLTHELIDVIWSKENNPEFYYNKNHILHVMEQLNIIAIQGYIAKKEKNPRQEEHYFLAPCMLQQETPEELISPKLNSQIESSPVLCYVFIGNFLPSPIFHRLVAACIAHWPVAKKKKEHREENLIFCGCCVFQLDEQHKLTLHFREHVIFLRVTRMAIKDKTPSSKLCIEVRNFITRNLHKIIGYLGMGLKFEYFIQCPEYNDVRINSLIPVSRLKEEAEVHCAFHDHIIESCKVLDFWFEEKEQSGDSPVIPAEILRMDEGSLELYRQALKDGIEKVYSIRVMVVGHYGVGKTTLVQRLLGKDVKISERTSTEGIDIHRHCFDVSLTSQEWTVQEKDAEKTNRLQRLMKLINEKVQMANISDEEDGNKMMEEMEKTFGAYASNGPYDDDIKIVVNLKQMEGTKVDFKSQQKESEVNMRHGTGNNFHSDGKHFMASRHVDFFPSGSEKNDPAMEILEILVENAGKLERVKVAKAGVSLWDFAGQFVFYTTHQTFLTTRAVYLLVIDLSQQITDDVKDDECFFDREGRKVCKVHDFIEVWLNSIHTCSPSPEARIPAVILVGTHADKIPQDSRKKVCESVFTQIRCQLQDKPTRFHLADEDFVIDNTVFDPKLEKLKRKIVELASQQPFWEEGVPARWLHLEQLLMKLKDTGVKVIPYSLVESLNKKGSIQIETKEEMDLFLRFLHDTGTILYFNTVRLREKIVLDPQWFIHALKSLITAETFVSKDMAVFSKWYEFKKNGKLTLELIDAVWTKKKNPQLHDNKEHILLLMEQLNIVARPRSFSHNGDEVKVESYLIAPCMLCQMTPKEIITPEPNPQMESTSVLCYVFKEKFLPPAIFHRLFASCMACWPIAKKGKETLVFCGGCVFDLDQSHRLYLHFRDYVIFSRITRMGIKERTPNGKFCLKVRESITEKLDEIIKGVGQRLDFEVGVQCPRCDGDSFDRIVRVSVLQGCPEVVCHCHDTGHVIRSRDLLKLWFEDSEEDKIDDPSSCLALNILDEVPSEKHMNRLSMKIGKEYVQLGIELEVPMYRIEQIQMENCRIVTQCFKILQEWVQRDKGQATFRNLEKACRRVGIDVSILKKIF